jgi:hypothetical protein
MKPGPALVIPPFPYPIGAEWEDVEIKSFVYTSTAGIIRKLPTQVDSEGNLQIAEIVDAYYFSESPYEPTRDLNFLLDSSFQSDLLALAHCLILNRVDLEAQIHRKLNAVAIVIPKSTSMNSEQFFYPDSSVKGDQDFLLGFKYSGSSFSELDIVYREKKNGRFDDRFDYLGDVFIESGHNLLDEIKKVAVSGWRPRHFPNPPPVRGLEYRLIPGAHKESHPSLAEVTEALAELPAMKSLANGVLFTTYYRQRRDLLYNRTRYLGS